MIDISSHTLLYVIKQNQFELYYQPQIDTLAGRIPQREVISPFMFIPAS